MQAELAAWWHKRMREGVSSEDYAEHTDISSGHGRIETRTCQQLLVKANWLDKKYQWYGLKSVIQVTSEVYDKSTGKQSIETRWYLSSLELDAEQALHCVRSHWQVESMHWVLDMTFREDESRIRRGNGALAFNVMRKIAMALFKQDESKKASMKAKKKMARLDDNYRSTLLQQAIKMR